jgi:hypothetical protein
MFTLRTVSLFLLDGVFEYNAASCTMQPESSGVTCLFLMSYNFGIPRSLQLKHFGGNFLPELNAGILG